MKYKKENDNRYRVRFMRETEELMDNMTVEEFIYFLKNNAEYEDEETTYIDGKLLNGKVYAYHEPNSSLTKEFIVTDDGRVFYWLSLLQKIELVNK